jgi:hypothetical protein
MMAIFGENPVIFTQNCPLISLKLLMHGDVIYEQTTVLTTALT